jgi:hypothetical protein
MDFLPFPKIARLSRDMVITEKLDGTNAQLLILTDNGSDDVARTFEYWRQKATADLGSHLIIAGSRTRYVVPGDDNFGFAAWVRVHAEELVKLGAGRHFGEWYGRGINRGYGLNERRFALFNTGRWISEADAQSDYDASRTIAPSCCDVVPVLYRGPFETHTIWANLERLRVFGSVAVPGFMKPEGIVIYHTASGALFKKTIEGDEKPKGAQ